MIGIATNNTSNSETAREMGAIITYNGKKNEAEQHVNVKIGEANNQHLAVTDENELREFTVNFSEVIKAKSVVKRTQNIPLRRHPCRT